jgi:hypothetical protein
MKSHRKTITILGTAVAIVAVAAMMYAPVVPAKATDGDKNPGTGNPHSACGSGDSCTPKGTETGNPHIGSPVVGIGSFTSCTGNPHGQSGIEVSGTTNCPGGQ